MNLFQIILFIAIIVTASVLADNEPSSTKKSEEKQTEGNTTEAADSQTHLNASQSAPNYKRSIANYAPNTYAPQYGFNRFVPLYQPIRYESSTYAPRSKKSKSRRRKSRQKNKNKFGREKKVFYNDNQTPQLKIKNTKPLININLDFAHKNSKEEAQQINIIDQQTPKLHSKRVETESQSPLPENTSPEHVSTKPKTTERDSKGHNQNNNTPAQDVKSISTVAEPLLKKSGLLNNVKFDPQVETIKSDDKKAEITIKKLEPKPLSIPAPNVNLPTLETKKTEPEIKKPESESDLKQNTKAINQSEINLHEIRFANVTNQSKLPVESRKPESDLKLINLKDIKTEINNKSLLPDKTREQNTENKESQLIPTKAENQDEKKEIENKHKNIDKTKPKNNTFTNLKKVESENKKQQLAGSGWSESAYENSDSRKKIIQQQQIIKENNNKEEFKNFFLDSILSDWGINISDPQINSDIKTNLKPDLKQLVSTESNIYIPGLTKESNKPSASSIAIVKPDNFKSKDTRPESETSRITTQVSKFASTNRNKTPGLKDLKADPQHKIVNARSNTYVPSDVQSQINTTNSQAEGKQLKLKSPGLQNEQRIYRQDYAAVLHDKKNTETKLTKPIPKIRKTESDRRDDVSEIRNSKPNIEDTKPRLSKPNYQESKPLPTPNSRINPNKLKRRTASGDSKNKGNEAGYHDTKFKFGVPETKNTKFKPEYIGREPKYGILEPKIRRPETRYKNSQVPLEPDHKKSQPRDKVTKYDKEYEPHKQTNNKYGPRGSRTNYQGTKIAYEGRIPKTTKLVTDTRRTDSKYRISEENYKQYEPEFKEIRPKQHKVIGQYGKAKPSYKKSKSSKDDQEVLESEYRKLKPSYEKYRPERKIQSNSGRSSPGYRIKIKKPLGEHYINHQKEKKNFVRPKYIDININDDPDYNESKIEYKMSRTKDKNSDIELKLSELKLSESNHKISGSTTERLTRVLEVKTEEPSLTLLAPGSKEGKTPENTNFFYTVINKLG